MNGYVSCEKNVIKSIQLVNSRWESNAFSSQLSNFELVLQTLAQCMCIVSLRLHIMYKHVIKLTFGYAIIMLRILSKSTFAKKVLILNVLFHIHLINQHLFYIILSLFPVWLAWSFGFSFERRLVLTIYNEGLIWHLSIRPSIYFSLIVISRFLLKETTGVFDEARIHDLHSTSQTCNPLCHAALYNMQGIEMNCVYGCFSRTIRP